MQVQIGIAKVSKYASLESGDTVEVIERPAGGISVVLVDGQRSGRSAKMISNIVARKAISLLGEGVRDGAAARAAHDYLRTQRGGQVTADLQLLSVDLETHTLVISRNTRCPVYCVRQGELSALDEPSEPIGIHHFTRPVSSELALEVGTYLAAFTDGLIEAGGTKAAAIDIERFLSLAARDQTPAQALADQILSAALVAESGRPHDDMCIVILCIQAQEVPAQARRMSVYLPIPPF